MCRTRKLRYLVSSLHRVQTTGNTFCIHESTRLSGCAEFFSDLSDTGPASIGLLLQSRNFKHDPDDPGKKERYQAEALIWKHLPINALLGVCCYNQAANSGRFSRETARRKLEIDTRMQPSWYF